MRCAARHSLVYFFACFLKMVINDRMEGEGMRCILTVCFPAEE